MSEARGGGRRRTTRKLPAVNPDSAYRPSHRPQALHISAACKLIATAIVVQPSSAAAQLVFPPLLLPLQIEPCM